LSSRHAGADFCHRHYDGKSSIPKAGPRAKKSTFKIPKDLDMSYLKHIKASIDTGRVKRRRRPKRKPVALPEWRVALAASRKRGQLKRGEMREVTDDRKDYSHVKSTLGKSRGSVAKNPKKIPKYAKPDYGKARSSVASPSAARRPRKTIPTYKTKSYSKGQSSGAAPRTKRTSRAPPGKAPRPQQPDSTA